MSNSTASKVTDSAIEKIVSKQWAWLNANAGYKEGKGFVARTTNSKTGEVFAGVSTKGSPFVIAKEVKTDKGNVRKLVAFLRHPEKTKHPGTVVVQPHYFKEINGVKKEVTSKNRYVAYKEPSGELVVLFIKNTEFKPKEVSPAQPDFE